MNNMRAHAIVGIGGDVARRRIEEFELQMAELNKDRDTWKAKAKNAEAEARKAKSELTRLLTSTEPGTLPYWQHKHDELALKHLESITELAKAKAANKAMAEQIFIITKNTQTK